MERDRIREVLERVRARDLTVAQAFEQLRHDTLEPLGFATLDYQRAMRRGFPEVVYGPGKTTEQMEGALPSVIAGLTDCPVIGVPTSTGYGAGGRGEAALLAMLNSCAAGVTVVNIDNGFGAGFAAGLINAPRRPGPKTPE